MEKNSKYVWCIAYIRPDQLTLVEKQIKQFKNIEAYIPTVKLLKKTLKNKPEFTYVPLLFNYGFFKIPVAKASKADFLAEMREKITAIYAWVKEPKKATKFPITNQHGAIDWKTINASIATDAEIANLVTKASELSIHSQEDLEELNAGDTVMLRGYPFEGLYAEITSIDKKKHKIEVRLSFDGIFRKITVDFQNVFYTVYASDILDSLMGHEPLDTVMETKNFGIKDIKY